VKRFKVLGLISLPDALDTRGRHEEAVIDTFHMTAIWRIQYHRFRGLARRVRLDVEGRRSEISVIEQD